MIEHIQGQAVGPISKDLNSRVIQEGKLFASIGDDKLVKIWNADSWHCTKTIRSEKRVSAVSFSLDGQFLIFADKFGVVWVTTIVNADNLNCKTDKMDPLLAHCCSIITGIRCPSSPG